MSLLVKPDAYRGRMETFGFEYLGFKTVRLRPGERHEEATGDREVAVVLLGGVVLGHIDGWRLLARGW